VADDNGAQRGVWEMGDLITPMAIRVAATLRVADHVDAGRTTAREIAEAEDVDPSILDRVLRHLVAAGVFSRNEAGEYGLTRVGEELRDDHADGERRRLDVTEAVGRADLSIIHLLQCVRTGEPAHPLLFGREFWDDLAAHDGLADSFARQMTVDVSQDAEQIVPAYDWGSLGHVVDVGGGNGALTIALLRAFPSLRGTIFDLPEAAAGARQAVAAAGLNDRCDVVEGSFFDALPPGADGYVLSAIVHDWSDDPATAILRRCAEAAGTTGRVFVVEKIGGDGETIRTGMDLRVLAYMGGKERGVAELTRLASGAGLEAVAVHPGRTLTILELAPAG
jgi:SAM-dependent methyltransferase